MTVTDTRLHAKATTQAWHRLHPRLTPRAAWIDHDGPLPAIQGRPAAGGPARPEAGLRGHDEDVARLSPFVRHHVNLLGRYSFLFPEMPGGPRPLRDADAAEE
ncbi:hypothetical protein ACFCYB_25140 [Streptomyces sp. NPDC056309]|uniref:hypothetical protein n=1 Tax=unclassified Streptomyces TaxID=2593676 RepID=UPI0035E11C2F